MASMSVSVEQKEKDSANAVAVGNNVNVILQTLMATLKGMDIGDIQIGKGRACREGWKTEGYAVYSEASGMINGDVVLGMDPLMARQMVRRILSKRFQISDFEFRLAVQMLANEVLVAALDFLAQVNIRVSLSAPQVFSRFEWNKTSMAKAPMIEISLATPYGVCQLAFNIRNA